MNACTTIAELHSALAPLWRTGAAIGLVPTMGALHEGHLSHVRRAREHDEVVVASVFVNPTQFGPSEDLTRYPRTPERDAASLEAEGVDVLFMPSAEEMYPPGFATRVEVGRIGEVLEGASRPGHFSGVATVVLKLFELVRPTHAYFGQKDAQQLAVIRQMVRDFNLPVAIVAGSTIREPDGLAMSSRNAYLAPDERRAATMLYRALCSARERYSAGECDAEVLRQVMRETVSGEPLARLDYAELVATDTMEPLVTAKAGALLAIAARIGTTRLIDNLAI